MYEHKSTITTILVQSCQDQKMLEISSRCSYLSLCLLIHVLNHSVVRHRDPLASGISTEPP